jgi:hypothetical protein
MMLRTGDRGDAVKALQRGLNKLGALLLVDGEFGGGTATAVGDARRALGRPPGEDADDSLQAALAALPDPSPEITAAGCTFIAREEVTSAAVYRQRHHRPGWPGAISGITIGIGYDLRFVDAAALDADWGALLPAATRARLRPALGIIGNAALRDALRDVSIPLDAAMHVFLKRMVPQHTRTTRGAYPTLDALPAHRRAALVSLVLNRGASLAASDDRRREMRAIRDLLAAGRLDEVPAQFESMTRLWNPATARGLIDRRRREATLWRDGFAALRLA